MKLHTMCGAQMDAKGLIIDKSVRKTAEVVHDY
jgi:hypothetical protein